MQIDYEYWLKDCGPEIYAHNKKVGRRIRKILHQVGKDRLIDFWHFGALSACDYHDIGKSSMHKSFEEHTEIGARFLKPPLIKQKTNKKKYFAVSQETFAFTTTKTGMAAALDTCAKKQSPSSPEPEPWQTYGRT